MGTDPGQEPGTGGRRRLPAARLRPRATGQAPEPAEGTTGRGSLFAPRSFAGGRVQVVGCSPSCLLVSLIASIVLTLLLNLILGGLT